MHVNMSCTSYGYLFMQTRLYLTHFLQQQNITKNASATISTRMTPPAPAAAICVKDTLAPASLALMCGVGVSIPVMLLAV